MNKLRLLPLLAIILASVLAQPAPTYAVQTDPVVQCAEGVQLVFDGKSSEALPQLEAGFAARESATFANPEILGYCAAILGQLRDDYGNGSGALEAYQVALEIFQVSSNREVEGKTANNIGKIYHAQGKYDQALAYYEQALEILRKIGDRAGEGTTLNNILEGRILNNIGEVYHVQRQYDLGLEYFQRGLEIVRERASNGNSFNNIVEGRILNNIGEVYHNQEQYDLALEYFQNALDIFREVGNRADEGNTLNNIGGVYHAQGKYEQALLQCKQALEIIRDVGDRAIEGVTLNNIGLVYTAQAKYELALAFSQKALEIFREVSDHTNEGTALNNIGLVYKNQGKYEQALRYYKQALEIRREFSDRAGEGPILNNIGLVYNNQGKHEQALGHFNESFLIFLEFGVAKTENLSSIGAFYYKQGKYDLALVYFQQVLKIHRKVGNRAGEGRSLNNIGFVYDNQGKYDQALASLQQALEINREVGNRAGEGITLNNIGAVYDNQEKYEQALASLQQALEINREVGDRTNEGTALNNIGIVYEQQGHAEKALGHYEQSMDVLEAVRATAGGDQERTSFIAQYANLYDRAIRLYHEQGQDEDAFLTSERGRARSFLDSLATGKVQLSDEELQALIDQERKAHTERFALRDQLARVRAQNPPDTELIAELEAQLEAAEEAYSKAQTAIEARDDELAELVSGRSSLPTLAEVQALLDEETTLLSYWVLGEDGTLAFVITADELTVIELPDATPENLTAARDGLYQWLSKENAHPLPLRNLHSWLVTPLAEHLKTPKVGIIAHQALHQVPFAALAPSDEEPYFGEQHTLFRVPSASALSHIENNAANLADATQPALVFGNPTTELEDLAHAAKEAVSVAELLGAPVYIAGEADEARLSSDAVGAPVVHLAAHGSYNEANPLYSAIHLAAQGEKDGLLETHEVYSLDLSAAEMVVLSACQTNVGQISRGDDIVGLTRAFFFAGTPTLVSSLWNVDDEATELLMSAFYRNWQGGMGKAEALQAAQAELRETHPSPFYWAAFVVNGDPGEISKPETWGWAWLVIAGVVGLLGVVGVGVMWGRSRRDVG